jgi:hypothetical protein
MKAIYNWIFLRGSEEYGGADETRTRDLCRDRAAL